MYTQDEIRVFAEECLQSFKKGQTIPLPFNEFWSVGFNTLYNNPKKFKIDRIEDKTVVKIAPTTKELLAIAIEHKKEFDEIDQKAPPEKKDFLITELCKSIFKPAYEFEYTPPRIIVEYGGKKVETPIWFNTTMDGINVRLGYDNGDSATPGALQLGDNVVHMMLGGSTGSGKSVALNTAVCSMLLEYPPWELDLYLGDFKIVEMSRYANRIPTPHVKIVAATGSTEFIMSLYEELIREMNDRSILFQMVGVQKVADFRNKFGMVMPRYLLLVDEFAQMYENIKESAERGNDNAAEDKKKVDAALSAIARLGRSMGGHMCLSSQALDNLDQSVAGNFQGGASLKATPAVSKSLIGNEAGSTIIGKGKGFYNMNKLAPNSEDYNIFVRIPFLQSEQTEEEAAAGKLTNLLEIINTTYDWSKKFGFDKGLVYYNENSSIPYFRYVEGVEWCKKQIQEKAQSNDIDDVIFTKTCIAYLPLGPEIRLSDDPVRPLRINADKNNSLLVHATSQEERNYIVNILKLGFREMYPNAIYYVINGSENIVLGAKLNELSNCVFKRRAVIPKDLLGKINNRNVLLELQSRFDDAITDMNHDFDEPTHWNSDLAWSYIVETQRREFNNAGVSVKDLESYASYVRETNNFDCIPDTIKDSRLISVKNLINFYNSYFITYNKMITKGRLTPKSFGLIVVWLAGVDRFENIMDSDTKNLIKYIMENAPLVNVIPIALAGSWSKVGSIFENTNFILECCDKTFFMDIGLPKAVNCNKSSFQIHDRLSKQRFIVSKYSSLSS